MAGFWERWRAAGREVRREQEHARAIGVGMAVVSMVNDAQERCHLCGFPWVGNGAGPADCACTLGKREARKALKQTNERMIELGHPEWVRSIP